jgi:predicted adenylyl cyclase CyaB
MKNIEIKARLRNPQAARTIASRLSGREKGDILKQIDTFYNVPAGRLKLREEEAGGKNAAQLISYIRPDENSPKTSSYEIVVITDPEGFKKVMSHVPGVRLQVVKVRELFLYKNARIHIDTVEGLGDFIEFEVVLNDSQTEDEGRIFAEQLIEMFGLLDSDMISCAYADMIEKKYRRSEMSFVDAGTSVGRCYSGH